MDYARLWNRYVLKFLEIFVAPYSVLRKVFPQLVMLSAIVFAIAWVFVVYQRLDWISAIYASVGMVTTIGLYTPDINQMPPDEKLILTVLLVSTIGLFGSLLQSTVHVVVDRASWTDARARWRGSHMRNHVLVIGDSPSVVYAVEKLKQLDRDYVVLTPSQELSKDLANSSVILGDPKEEKNLLSAGVMEASTAIVAMNNDSDTLLVTLKVQKLNPQLLTVSVVKDSGLIDVMRTAGADVVIPSDDIIGRIMAVSAVSKGLAGILYSPRERDYSIAYFDVKKEIKLSQLPEGVIPIAIVRGKELDPYFSRETAVKPGEGLFVLGDPSKFKEVEKMLS
ncbi:MAG: potassium channel family protein [Thermoprotei archaeon]